MSNYESLSTKTLDSKDYSCGLFGWRPERLQRLSTTRVFLIVFGVLGVIQGANYTYMVASITTLEKRFSFGSKTSGLILMTDNVMQLITNPLFGFLANRVHRPRMIATCQLIVVFGCYLAAVPYFLYEYTALKHSTNRQVVSKDVSALQYCNDSSQYLMECAHSDGQPSGAVTVIPAVIIFCIASCCNGIGFTAFYIIGIPFIDDNVPKENSPLYISITGALRLVGPTLGYILSSLCLRFYENPFVDPGIKNNDQRWVGAWWLGFLILGTGILICTLPMFAFPKHFKSSPLLNRSSYITIKNSNTNSEFGSTLRRLASNTILICYTCGMTVNLFALFGYLTFLSKYMESEYRQSASSANLYSGLIGVAPAALGILIGGTIICHFKPGPRLLTTLIAMFEIMGLFGIISAMFLGCPSPQLYGAQQNGHFNLQTNCNNVCKCETKLLDPICGPDGTTTYFSPCFAGCRPPNPGITAQAFDSLSNCNCFPSVMTTKPSFGYCSDNCHTFTSFASLIALGNFVGNLAKTGISIIIFRIVEERDKSFALGLSGAFMNIFAFIPYPLVYGAITDATCLVWGQSCGQRGNCWLYSPQMFRYYIHGITLVLLCLSSVFDIIVILLSNRIDNLYDDRLIDGKQCHKQQTQENTF